MTQKRKNSILVFFITTYFVLSFQYHKAESSPLLDKITVLTNGILIDGTGSPPLHNAVVIIKNQIITAVGRQGTINLQDEAEIIDQKGASILPGFINAHIHNGYNKSKLRAWAKGGVTTVRDLGGNPRNNLFSFRDQVLKNPEYARLVAAGPMVTVPSGYPAIPWGSQNGLAVRSPEDARKKVLKLLDDGADIIKIALDSGKSFGRTIPMLSPAEAKEVVKAAHQRGAIVSAHVLVCKDLEQALNAGVDDIAHMVWDVLPDDIINRMIKENVYWVPTLELWQCVNTRLRDLAVKNLSRFVKAGGKVALGTDYDGNNCKFDLGMPLKEIRLMQAAGMSPMQIIVAATKNASYVCNLEDKIGTLEAGKMADLFIVKDNPLDDLNALSKVRMVIHSGTIIHSKKNLPLP
jgi:imidazolonepropionase-like amidohydrolase